MDKISINNAGRDYLYEQLKGVLDQKFPELGNKNMKDVYGPTTQALIREAIHTYCFFKEINVEIKKVPRKSDDPDEKLEPDVFYVFKLPIKMPVFGEDFNIMREINAKKFGL